MTSRPGPDNNANPNGQTPSDQTPNPGGSAVERIIERFGGIRPMASKLDIPVTTVQGWKKRGAIPAARHPDLRAAAVKHKIQLDDADLIAATPADEQPSEPVPPAEAAIVATPEGVPAEGAPNESKPEDTPAGALPAGGTPVSADGIAAPDERKNEGKEETRRPNPETAKPTTTGASAARVYEPAPRRSGAGFATAVSLLALLVGAAALSEPWWGPRVPGWPSSQTAGTAPAPVAQPSQADADMSAQIQRLTERFNEFEQRAETTPAPAPDAPGAPSADVQSLTERLNALEERIASAGTSEGAAPPAPGADGGEDTAALQSALAQLTGRLDGLEQRATQQAEEQQRVAELSQKLTGLEQRLSEVGNDAQAAQALQQEVASLKEQLASVNQTVDSVNQTVESRNNAAAQAQALVLAAGQLRTALASGQPFQQELQGMRALGIGDPQVTQPLDTLAPHAGKGVPTLPQLSDRFGPLASEIVRADNRGDGQNWVDQVKGTLSTLVTIRREGGGVVGDSADAVVARAQAALKDGNLAKAVEELSALQGSAAATAAPWVADAQARLAADQAGQQLSQRAIALMTAASGVSDGASSTNGAAQ